MIVDSIIEYSSWVGLLGAVVFQNNFSVCVGKRSKGSYNWFPWRIHPPTLHHFSSLKFSNFGHETVRIFGTWWWWSWERICQFSKPHLRLSFYSFFSLRFFWEPTLGQLIWYYCQAAQDFKKKLLDIKAWTWAWYQT